MNVVYYEIPRSNYAHIKPFFWGMLLFVCLRLLIGYLRSGTFDINVSDINYSAQFFSVVL